MYSSAITIQLFSLPRLEHLDFEYTLRYPQLGHPNSRLPYWEDPKIPII